MLDLQALTRELMAAEAVQDLDAMLEARKRIIAHSPGSAAAAEALYKIALDALFRGKDLAQAIALLEQAAKSAHPFWAPSARTSLALCYLQQKRGQKAMFELRKVAYPKVPSAHSITALTFMETIFAQDHKTVEAARVRKDRQQQLQQLLDGASEQPVKAQERGHFLHQLALACLDSGERSRAKKALDEALALGGQVLGQELLQAVQLTAKLALA